MVFNKYFALLALVLVFGCQSKTNNTATSSEKSLKESMGVLENQNKNSSGQMNQDALETANTFSQLVMVQYIELEGGFYAFISDKGEKYLPLNLAREYRQAGLKLKITAKSVSDVVTIYQWGTTIKILNVERL